MITGTIMIIAGLFGGFYGATGFNFGQMVAGWLLAGAGAVILAASFVHPP